MREGGIRVDDNFFVVNNIWVTYKDRSVWQRRGQIGH